MRSTASDDLTTRDRIRDAAIMRVAQDGTSASLRSIATEAGVSAALILHHFGSRAGLREACDEHVVARIHASKSEVLSSPGDGAALLVQLAQVEGYAVIVAYVLRCLQEGGAALRRFVDHLAQDTLTYLEEGERAGNVSPSRWPQERARLLTEQALGALLLQLPAHRETFDLDALPAWLRDYSARIVGPYLELYTEPLLPDRIFLDAYLATLEPPTTPGDAPPEVRVGIPDPTPPQE